VTVLNDGSDGKPAVIRARGKLHPLPFFEALIGVVYNEPWTDIDAAIDYELAPGADHGRCPLSLRVVARGRRGLAVDAARADVHGAHARVPAGKGFDTRCRRRRSSRSSTMERRAGPTSLVTARSATSLAASGFLGSFAPASR